MEDLDALLADLQNSVPVNTNSLPHTTHHVNTHHSSPGYGSLNTGRPKQSPQSPTYQTQTRIVTEKRTSPVYNNPSSVFNGSNQLGYQSTPHNSLPRSGTPQHQTGNLSELDTLLQDLSSARYGSNLDKKDGTLSPIGNDSLKRPSVDSLLDELSSAHNVAPIYALPNGNNGAESVVPGTPGTPGGRHVTITVRETTTEKISGQPGSPPLQNNQMQQTNHQQISQQQTSQQQTSHQQTNHQQTHQAITQTRQNMVANSPAPTVYAASASSATKELDDLMASLSDFKINQSSHQHQTVTDYAKPNKGTSHFSSTQTVVTTTTEQQRDQLDSMLGNLQADMSRQGVNTQQKGCCTACEKPIVGQVITALGKTWHPEHFTCNHCNQELGTRNFFERDGHPYCESDYHNLFSPRCAYCNGPILDKCVTALEKTWHTEHFFCAQCGQHFGEEGFHERDGKPYCRNDYFDQFAPKCNGCNRAIMENYISALNSQWHPDCFVCRDCRQPFQGGSFFDHDGLPYCETHYHAKRGSLCAGCSKPITGRCITAMFKKFHPEHFVCAFCLKQLNKGTFKEQNDKPYCHICFDKLFG